MQFAGAILLSLTLLTEVSSIVEAQACNPRCGAGVYWAAGKCQSDGRCLCWWGWTGPNAQYIISGQNHHRIKADYCETACNYNNAYYNPSCASMPVAAVPTTAVPLTTTGAPVTTAEVPQATTEATAGASRTTKAALPTTTKPSLTTTPPSLATTEVPLMTTGAPQTTTDVSVVTTKAPQTTTGASLTTTAAQVTTNKVSLPTTGAPGTTAKVLQTTTAAPGTTKAASLTTTKPSLTTTSPPLAKTGAPLTTTGAPLMTTQAPLATTAEVPQTTAGEALLPSKGSRSEVPETRAATLRATEEEPTCPTEYCQNGGTCTVQLGSPTCECKMGRFQGAQCQDEIPLPIPCLETDLSEVDKCAEDYINAGGVGAQGKGGVGAQGNDQSSSSSNVYIGVGVALPLAIVAIVVLVVFLFKRRKSRQPGGAYDNEVTLQNESAGPQEKGVDQDNPTYGVVLAPQKSDELDSGFDISNPEYEIVLNNCPESSRAASSCPADANKSFHDPPVKGKEKGTDTEDGDYEDPTALLSIANQNKVPEHLYDSCGLPRDEASKGEMKDTDYADPTTMPLMMTSPTESCGSAQDENLYDNNEAKEAASLRQDAELCEMPQNVSTTENEGNVYEQPVADI